MLKKCPCMECNERHVNCHADCDNYKIWKNEFDEHKQKIVENQRTDRIIRAEKRTVINKAKKMRQFYSK